MKKPELTKTENEYNCFDKISKVIIYSMLILAFLFVIPLIFAKDDGVKILFGLLLVADTAAIIIICSLIAKKRSTYLQMLFDERNAIIRTGVFKEIYEEYRHDGFEFNLCFDKLLFEEYHNNTIDIGFIKNSHEFLIEISEKSIFIIVDEETDRPIETELMLSDVDSIEKVYLAINTYVKAHC